MLIQLKNSNTLSGDSKTELEYTRSPVHQEYYGSIGRDKISHEVLQHFYDDYCFFNQEQIIPKYYDVVYYKLDDINIMADWYDVSFLKKWDSSHDNPYLSETSEDKKQLGIDILENGMFWPFVVANGKGPGCVAHEGKHRIEALRLIDASSQKFRCIVCNPNLNIPEITNEWESPAEIHIPSARLQRYLYIYPEVEYEEVDEYITAVFTETPQQTFYANCVYPFWLRNYIWEYNKNNPESSIKPWKANMIDVEA